MKEFEMAVGRRYGPEDPSPAMKDFTKYIQEHGYPDVTESQVAATAYFHREWQIEHAERTRQERKVANAQKEEDRKVKEAKREQDKLDRAAKKQADEDAKELRKKEREDAKAAKAAAGEDTGADGDDTDSAPDGESRRTRRRLNTKEDAPESVSAGVSESSF
jgi:hypothetical protein